MSVHALPRQTHGVMNDKWIYDEVHFAGLPGYAYNDSRMVRCFG